MAWDKKHSRTLEATLLSTTNTRELIGRIAEYITSTYRLESAGITLKTYSGGLISSGHGEYARLGHRDIEQIENGKGGMDSAATRALLISHRLQAIVPLKTPNQTIGYVLLSERPSRLTSRRLIALTSQLPEIFLALENALRVQEVRDLNDMLRQRITQATRELRHSNNQLQRLDKAKDEFVSMASHQLRTPLTSIKGYLSMVLEGDVGNISLEQRKYLEQAFNSSERMVHLIGDFLNVSRLQTGKFVIEQRPINLARLVREEIDSLRTSASSRGLSFTYDEPRDIPDLMLDEDKFRQVIMNFADNAIYYSKAGTSIDIVLRIVGESVEFLVVDHGIGVPRAEQSQLFNKFFRASNARRQRPDGTGVGIFLARKVVRDHGGDIVFHSVEGEGSTFGFTLPLEKLRAGSETDHLGDQPNQ